MGQCLVVKEGSFGCGHSCQGLRDFPSVKQGPGGNISNSQSTLSAIPIGRLTKEGHSSCIGGGQHKNGFSKCRHYYFISLLLTCMFCKIKVLLFPL